MSGDAGTAMTSNPVGESTPMQNAGERIDAGTDGISNPVAAATPVQAGRERIDAGTARTSNPVAAATSAQPGGERIDAGTTATSNLVAAATSAQAGGERIDAGTAGTSNNVAAPKPAEAGEEIIDARSTGTSNPMTAAMQAQAGGAIIDAGTAGTSNAVAAATQAQACGEIIETTGASIPVAAATPAQGDEEIIDAGTARTFNPMAMPAQDGGEIIDAGTARTFNPVAMPAQDGREIIDEGTAETSNNSSEHVVISMARPPFRAVNKDLLTPLSVPIGPYHRARCSERWKQEKKRVAEKTESLVDRGRQLRHEVGQLEKDVRACYGGLRKMKRDELVRMLLEDGCYVLNSLVKYHEDLDVIPPRGERNTVMRDILYLFENQLPMIVLERIHKCLTRGRSVVEDVEECVRKLLKDQLYIRGEDKPRGEQAAPCHLLQLVHCYFQPFQPYVEGTDNTRRRVGRWRRATEYSRYGNVQLKPREFEHGVESILDVHLKGGTLWIPRLWIDSSTWTILRNLMALEEETGTGGSPVTAYCLFMSQLASKVEDIELLKRKKIVDHSLGNDEEVAQGFADLWKKVVLDDVDNVDSNYLRDTWYKLDDRCENRGHNFWGSFRHIHCGDSMRILAFVTAGLLFAFQLIQVILTGFSLRQHGK